MMLIKDGKELLTVSERDPIVADCVLVRPYSNMMLL